MLEEPKCYTRKCKHFIGVKQNPDGNEGTEHAVCTAFLGGIPDDIAYGDNKHLTLVDGDHGITFERGS